MAAQPVEWVLVVYYGPSAHRATYGRLDNTKYTKDYIQLSRQKKFLETLRRLFPATAGKEGRAPLTYKWPTGTASGELIFRSADRPHLKWETSHGAPKVWKMSRFPGETVAETIPGNPNHTEFEKAENELKRLANGGVGQPYLMAIKLRNESATLHLRAYIDGPRKKYAWADLRIVPPSIRALAAKTSQRSALAWKTFDSGGVAPSAVVTQTLEQLASSRTHDTLFDALDANAVGELAAYFREPGHGLFFDPSQNHDAWIEPAPLSKKIAASVSAFLETVETEYPLSVQDDAAAETAEFDPNEVEAFQKQIESKNYSVADVCATVKTRGSAQRAFANAVKSNYKYRCAITGIKTKDFLVASHIVPWSEDHSIRLDPSNGICLSLLMDRAFEKGYLLIGDDLTIRIGLDKVGNDSMLRRELEPYEGLKLTQPKSEKPKLKYLQRRRALVSAAT